MHQLVNKFDSPHLRTEAARWAMCWGVLESVQGNDAREIVQCRLCILSSEILVQSSFGSSRLELVQLTRQPSDSNIYKDGVIFLDFHTLDHGL